MTLCVLLTRQGYNLINVPYVMPTWKTDATEFVVSVNHNAQNGSSVSRIPKPLLARLGNPDKLKFVIQGDKIVMGIP